jgi:hypothetical protein
LACQFRNQSDVRLIFTCNRKGRRSSREKAGRAGAANTDTPLNTKGE